MTFYEFMMRHVNPDAKDPTSRLANTMHNDESFPKMSEDFHEISSYLEGSIDYSKLLVVFDDLWHAYEFSNK